jgi:hypothetical protein
MGAATDLQLTGLPWILIFWSLALVFAIALLVFRRALEVFADGVAIAGLLIIGAIGALPGAEGAWEQQWSSLFRVGFRVDLHTTFLHATGAFLGLVFLVVYRGRGDAVARGSATLFSALGFSIAWLSLTLWTSLVGLSLTLVGALISRLPEWDDEGEADGVSQFVKERFLGVAIALCGTATWVSATPGSAWVGGVGIVLGLFLQFGPYPFLNGAVRPTRDSGLSRVILTQLAPAGAALAPLINRAEDLTRVGVFPHFGWIACAGAFLALFTGLFSTRRSSGFAAWLVSGFCLALTTLCFAGSQAGTSIFIGLFLGAGALAASRLAGGAAALTLGILSGAMVLGFPGSISAPGWVSLLESGVASGAVYAFGFLLFGFMLLTWCVVSHEVHASIRDQKTEDTPTIVAISFWILGSFAVFWIGRWLGAWVDSSSDSFGFEPLVALAVKSTPLSTQQTGAWVFLQLFVVAAGLGFALGRRGDRDPWMTLAKKIPRISGFVAQGYGTRELLLSLTRGVSQASSKLTYAIEELLWSRWIPAGIHRVLGAVSGSIDRIDGSIRGALDRLVYQAVDAPGKFLQVIQNGDVRWYLTFALGSALAVLLHFLRNVT